MRNTKSAFNFKKVLAVLLYSIPVVFFIVCYFMIITSGEDIFQGAKSQVDIIGDATAAFKHSVRLADMFAWSVINFFDYNYSFGPDTIFRLLDILMALSIFYMATYLILRRRPRLELPDAAVFSSIFLAFFLTSNGLTMYTGFSAIHNYLFMGFFTLLFGTFYLRDFWSRKTSSSLWFVIFMLVLGFIFGFASNVTPVVFLVTLAVYGIYKWIILRKRFWPVLKKFIFSWRFAGVVGVLLAMILVYVIGSGLGDYDTDPGYRIYWDYVPIAEIFENFGQSLGKILWHIVYNFGRFLTPFAVMSVGVGVYALCRHLKPTFKNLKVHRDFLVASVAFIVLHVLAMSQIIYPTRSMLAAYIFGVVVFIFVVIQLFFTGAGVNKVKENEKRLLRFSSVLLVVSMLVLIVRFYFAFSYVSKVVPVLEDIKNTDSDTYCVKLETAHSNRLPYIYLGQEDFLVDWALPQTIYGKTVTYCE